MCSSDLESSGKKSLISKARKAIDKQRATHERAISKLEREQANVRAELEAADESPSEPEADSHVTRG